MEIKKKINNLTTESYGNCTKTNKLVKLFFKIFNLLNRENFLRMKVQSFDGPLCSVHEDSKVIVLFILGVILLQKLYLVGSKNMVSKTKVQ